MKYPGEVKYIVRYEHYFNKKEGEYWVVTVPDVKGVVTQGFTFDEAVEMSKEALALILSCYVDDKKPFPKQKFKLRSATKRTTTKEIVLSLEYIMEFCRD